MKTRQFACGTLHQTGWLLLILAITHATSAPGATSEILATAFPSGSGIQYINGFELITYPEVPPQLVWWQGVGDCTVEFRSYSAIGFLGDLAPDSKPAQPVSDCTIRIPGVGGGRISSDIYYAASTSSSGGIFRKYPWAEPADPPQTLYSLSLSGNDLGALTLYKDKLYWSLYNNTYFSLWSMNTDGSNQQFVQVHSGGRLARIAGFDFPLGSFNWRDVLFLLTAGGNLLRLDLTNSPTAVLLASDVTDFALRHESIDLGNGGFRIYSALYFTTGKSVYQGKPSGSLVKYDIGLGTQSTLYTASGGKQLTAVTADDRNLYWNEQPIGCDPQLGCSLMDGSLYRRYDPADHTSTAGAPQLIGLPGGDSGVNLRSDGDFLMFQYANTIRRMRTDSPAIYINLEADGLEVVQAIQDLNSTVTLVANHPTYVRGYAHFRNDSTGKTNWQVGAQLHGFLNGQELPGSPIGAVRGSPLFPSTVNLNIWTQRASTDRSFLFRIPDAWVQLAPTTSSAQLNFQMVVNPFLAIPETAANPLSDNSRWLNAPATLAHGGLPCLVMVPLVVKGPIFNSTSPGYFSKVNQVVREASTFLPAEQFDVFPFTVVDAIGDWNNPLDFSKMTFDKAKPVWDSALSLVNGVHLWSDPFRGRDAHYVGMLSPELATPFIAGIGDRPGRAVVVGMGGGLPLAHELGHNYGRRHIHCPESFPPGQDDYDIVPFPCSLGDPNLGVPTATFAYDPLKDRAYAPSAAADLMSYQGPNRTSKFTWEAIRSAMVAKANGLAQVKGSLSSLSSLNGGQSLSDILLARGWIYTDSASARLDDLYIVPESLAPPFNVAESRADSDLAASAPNPFYVRFLSQTGQLLSQVALLARQTESTGTNSAALHFGQYLDCPQQAARLQIVQSNIVFVERFFSQHAPVFDSLVYTNDPAAQSLSLAWLATDPDGDRLSFTVQYSPDNGVSWLALRADYPYEQLTLGTQLLPGGPQALVRVIATDGANTASISTPTFSIPNHAPLAYIAGVAENQRLSFGASAELDGVALDPESGMRANNLVWSLSGPTPLSGSGDTLQLVGLSPGAYSATLNAYDPDHLGSTATRNFEVLPPAIPEGADSTIDGFVNDDGYAAALTIQLRAEDGGLYTARLFHGAGYWYIGFDDLRLGSPNSPRSIGVRLDSNNSRTSAAAAGDIGLFVDQNGIPRQEAPANGAMVTTFSPQPGFLAAIHRGTNRWSAEFRIAENLLAGWNHFAGLMFEHGPARWPASAGASQPVTWAQVYLGPALPGNSSTDRPPVADAGPAQTLHPETPQTVFLNGAGSYDPDGDALAYAWTQTGGPSVTLADANTDAPSFIASPVAAGTTTNLTFQLVVTAGSAVSAPSSVQITLEPPLDRVAGGPVRGGAAIGNDGQLHVRLIGQPGVLYQIQTSTDLVHWTLFRSAWADMSGRIEFTHPLDAAADPMRFFRAIGQ